jgi:hypothetical protein
MIKTYKFKTFAEADNFIHSLPEEDYWRIYDFAEDIVVVEVEFKFCGFCQGKCTGNHYISPSTDGY